MTNTSRNVVSEVLLCIQTCTDKQAELASIPAQQQETIDLKVRAGDMLQDIEIHLCKMAASLVTAPMSGRMFIPVPSEFVSEQAVYESRHVQLHGTH
jgi:hypothetical protein